MRKLLILIVVLAGVGGGLWIWHWRASAQPGTPPFKLAAITRGKLQAKIGATGTIEPEEVIDVGAQVAGRIEKFGPDLRDPTKPIDYGSMVDEGTILARIDDSVYRARRDSAKADLARARADLLQQKAKLSQAQRDLDRARSLLASRSTSQAEFDAALAAFETTHASVAVAEAHILQVESALKEAETNLQYTTIRSPVKGVIIDRRVNVGQTVVASLQAPSLFLIAKDLRKLQIWAAVNEADIGQIKIGQLVRFTVDAFPDRVFEGRVLKQGDFPARLNASMTQNVVTYTVVVSIDNSEGMLWPYLTANLQFIISENDNALLVPNGALRYHPRPEIIAPDAEVPAEDGDSGSGVVWVADGEFVRPLAVRLGRSDGLRTEIVGGDLREHMKVIIGENRSATSNGGGSPFAPKLSRGGRG